MFKLLLGQDQVSKALPSSGHIEEILVFYTALNVQMLVDSQEMLRTISELITNRMFTFELKSTELKVLNYVFT